jgi:peptidoglycan/LPS O-acetylase OafA/YrhL
MLAYLMLNVSPRLGAPIERAARRIAPLGNISYSLYIVHFPWLALIAAWWLSWHTRLPLGPELAIAGAISALALGAMCWWAVERHWVRRRIMTASIRLGRFVWTPES